MRSLLDIARLEEARLAAAIRDIAPEHIPLCGGIAGRGALGSWVNQLFGGGLAGPVQAADLAPLLDYHASRGIEPRIDLCPFADPSFIKAAAELNFTPFDFDHVLFRDLAPADRIDPINPPPPDLEIRIIRADQPDLIRALSATMGAQFTPDGSIPSEGNLEISDRALAHPRTIAVAAFLNDQLVGGGAMEIHEQIATLWGVGVKPEFRRRGIQQALLAERLRLARDRGASIATIGSRPGHITERNVRRMGFQVAYTKVILTRPAPGLTGVIG